MSQESPQQQEFKCGVVAIAGPPNSGKSTLLNCFLGEKLSIVTPKPQTTRSRISGILHQEDAQIVFLDTPGIHYSTQSLNAFLVETAWRALEGADQVLLLLDASRYADKPRRLHRDLGVIHKRLRGTGLPLHVALNKEDLVRDKKKLLPLTEALSSYFPGLEFFIISAAQGKGTQELLQHIKQGLPVSPPLFPEDQLSTLPMRFLAAEIIREKLFLVLEEELPYSVAVQVEYWQKDPEKDLVHLEGVIYVSRKNHKAMVIGSRGRKLKEVGEAARVELEDQLEQKVFLQLWVKVKPKWTQDRRFLLELSP